MSVPGRPSHEAVALAGWSVVVIDLRKLLLSSHLDSVHPEPGRTTGLALYRRAARRNRRRRRQLRRSHPARGTSRRRGRAPVPCMLAYSVIPIVAGYVVAGYVVAHYFSSLILQSVSHFAPPAPPGVIHTASSERGAANS